MNRRLQQFISAENITQSQFAEKIGVAKASVSHILAGRNKPGFDFIEGISRSFPDLNLDWLVSGRGKMYKSISQESGIPEEIPFSSEIPVSQDSPSRRITRIMVFYDDGTFTELQ